MKPQNHNEGDVTGRRSARKGDLPTFADDIEKLSRRMHEAGDRVRQLSSELYPVLECRPDAPNSQAEVGIKTDPSRVSSGSRKSRRSVGQCQKA
jgi:hypothetical protein